MNMISTNLHAWPFILEAQKKGAKIVVIDPVRTRTAKQADWHIAIRPGTDGALALGMMNVIIAEGLVDYDYVEKYTLGFDELKARAAQLSARTRCRDHRHPGRRHPDAGARICDDPAVRHPPGRGDRKKPRRRPSDPRSSPRLPALVGAWRHVGGGTVGDADLGIPDPLRPHLQRPDFIKPGTRVINELELGPALSGEMALDPPIKSLFVYNSNPVSQAPAQANKIDAGLAA